MGWQGRESDRLVQERQEREAAKALANAVRAYLNDDRERSRMVESLRFYDEIGRR